MWFSEGYTARVAEMYRTRDEATRQKMIRELTREAIDAAQYIGRQKHNLHAMAIAVYMPNTYVEISASCQ